MHEFQCSYRYETGEKQTWSGQWETLSVNAAACELRIRGRGSEVRAVLGQCLTGNYLCIPAQRIGCALACFTDLFWNTEELAQVTNITDAVTIAAAIQDYAKTLAEKTPM